MKRATGFLISLVLVGCMAALPLPRPQDVWRAQQRWHFADSAYLAVARQQYIRFCSGCHRAYHPARFPLQEWVKQMPEMMEEAKIDTATLKQIWHYILTFHDTTKVPPPIPHW